jgi:hypothetical protein
VKKLGGFELEYLLKCELASKSYERLLEIVSELEDFCPWAYLYVIDAFFGAGLLDDAHETAVSLTQKVLQHHAERGSSTLLYALALRLACSGDFSSAEAVAEHALNSEESASEVIRIRVATLLVIIAASTCSGPTEKSDAFLWDVLRESRHNVERLTACVAVAGTIGCDDKYLQGAMELANIIRLDLTILRPTVKALEALIGTSSNDELRAHAGVISSSTLQASLAPAEYLSTELFEVGERRLSYH